MDSNSESSRESSVESSVESALDDDKLKLDLETYLSDLEATGSFALFKPAHDAPNPGLSIKGAGIIGLPLSDRDAEAFIEASHQAPFGKGSQTIVDNSVRRTWELSADEFEIKNPAWNIFLNTILAHVEAGLGVAVGKGVAAQLYKLLLYDEGAMFKPHQDSEKAPRMFGTLVIALPSSHQGGEVVLTHASSTKTFSTSQHSDFGVSWMAWYSDVTHEVKPVTAGRRVVLTYNLVHTTGITKSSAADSFNQVQGLKMLLNTWDKNPDFVAHDGLAYILEHKYSDASICFENLKGRDQQIVNLLRNASADDRHFIGLANIEHMVSGECDEGYNVYDYSHSTGDFHEITEELDRSLTCSRVVDLDGNLLATDLVIDERDFVEENPFEGVEPDHEDYEGYTGNAGTSATHFYRRTVVLIVPYRARLEYLLSFSGYNQHSNSSRAMAWFNKLRTDLTSASEELLPLLHDDLKLLSYKIISMYVKWKDGSSGSRGSHSPAHSPFTKEVFDTVWQVAIHILKDEKSIISAWKCCGIETGDRYFDLGCAIWRCNLSNLLPQLSLEIKSIHKFSDRIKALRRLAAALSHMKSEVPAKEASNFGAADETMQSIKDQAWVAIDTLPLKTTEDGKELVEIEWLGVDREMFSQRIISAVRRHISEVPMVTYFLCSLFETPHATFIDVSSISTALRPLLTDFSDSMKLQPDRYRPPPVDPNKRVIGGYMLPVSAAPQASKPIAIEEARNLAFVLHQYYGLGMLDEMQKTLRSLSDQAKTLPIDSFEVILLPTLKSLLPRVVSTNLSTSSETPFGGLFQSVLASYICRYVQDPPSPPKNWSMPKRGCAGVCPDCRALDAFLINPHQSVGRFPMGQQRRRHIHTQLDNSDCTHETVRVGSPHTLVVTKTRRGHSAQIAAHEQRHQIAYRHIIDLGLENLKGLLGEYFQDIVGARTTPLLKNFCNGTAVLAGISGNIVGHSGDRVLPPISRRKIPGGGTIAVDAEVIDITSD